MAIIKNCYYFLSTDPLPTTVCGTLGTCVRILLDPQRKRPSIISVIGVGWSMIQNFMIPERAGWKTKLRPIERQSTFEVHAVVIIVIAC